ncbi:MAG: Tn3 family transposase, partial [Candidatus Omnitrophica bacterium]|nr:Tn3 family transposase [Candidatus Omnitrophota bacterium]
MKTLDLHSSTQQDALIKAMKYILESSSLKAEYLSKKIDLSFTTKLWRKLIIKKEKGKKVLNHKYLELCVLSHVANDLRSGDLFVVGADFYADYRKELLPWSVCEKMIEEYCAKVNI